MPMLTDLELNSQGKWTASDGLISGAYDFTVTYNGKTRLYSDYDLSSDGNFFLAIPEPSAALAGFVLFAIAGRRRRVG